MLNANRGHGGKALYVCNHTTSSSKIVNLILWSVCPWYWKLCGCQSQPGHFQTQGTQEKFFVDYLMRLSVSESIEYEMKASLMNWKESGRGPF